MGIPKTVDFNTPASAFGVAGVRARCLSVGIKVAITIKE